ncbi:Gfo/Idh/MocA family protein [Pseudooctadecabacter jejudonensis]|uniref:1,5-anhydro-D-fructose reductase n=1 Tax=Pseudooctadecabacter jejudonensis TaxID=1391910 RepID=A0A1Y5SCK6_9RHOB|nr:Gfo/Idh/MocA family oxidoreductase [Pseudooctadecabacter jejudonensis]SLN34849.1 1,5-anhydro-D-fructose reductase [Pseudooctadecabacter jejudonensis]
MGSAEPRVRVLILGTGGMAHTHAKAFVAHHKAELVAAVELDADRLAEFADTYEIETRFTSLTDAIEWGDFDAVSNVTPDGVHFATTKDLIAAGKDVLCEKPLATNQLEAATLASLAGEAGIVNMVNLSYRNVPALQEAARLVAGGEIGAVRHFEASYLQSWLTQDAWGDWKTSPVWLWRLSTGHGSKGVLGDVGIHILDFLTFVAGSDAADVSCRLRTFDKAPDGRIGEYSLDANDSCAMTVTLQNGAMGVVSASRFASGHHNDLRLRLYGDEGGLEVAFENGEGRLRTCTGGDLTNASWVERNVPSGDDIFDRFLTAVQSRQMPEPSFATGARLQAVLDAAEASDAQQGAAVLI